MINKNVNQDISLYYSKPSNNFSFKTKVLEMICKALIYGPCHFCFTSSYPPPCSLYSKCTGPLAILGAPSSGLCTPLPGSLFPPISIGFSPSPSLNLRSNVIFSASPWITNLPDQNSRRTLELPMSLHCFIILYNLLNTFQYIIKHTFCIIICLLY